MGDIRLYEFFMLKTKPDHYPFLPHVRGGRFANIFIHDHDKHEDHEHLLGSLHMFLHALPSLFKKDCCHTKQAWIGDQTTTQALEPSVTWFGHATCLVNLPQAKVITDPVFGSLSFLYKRKLPHIAKEHVSTIDVVLISHNHRDHLDRKSIQWLHKEKDPIFLVPQGDKQLLERWGITKVQELMWWESLTLNNTTYTFVPAWHWSQRTLFDRNRSLWGGWMIQDAQTTIYFAGDTAYNKDYFTAIAQQFPCIDLALLPIGPGKPEHLMRRSHINAELAGQVFLDVHARLMLPIHWGTFQFGHDRFSDPIKKLTGWWDCVMKDRPGYGLLLAPVGMTLHLLDRKNSYSSMHDQNHQKS